MRDMRKIKELEQKFESCLQCGDAVLALHYHRQLSAAYISMMHDQKDEIFGDVGQLEKELDDKDERIACYANPMAACLLLFFAFWYIGIPFYF